MLRVSFCWHVFAIPALFVNIISCIHPGVVAASSTATDSELKCARSGNIARSGSLGVDSNSFTEDSCDVDNAGAKASTSLVQQLLPSKHGLANLLVREGSVAAAPRPALKVKKNGTVVKVLWPRWGSPLTVTGWCIFDGVLWSVLVGAGLCFATVGVGRLIGRNAPTDGADDENVLEQDEEGDLQLTAESYAKFSARKRCWALIRRPESGPKAVALSIFINGVILFSLVTMTLESLYRIKAAIPGFFILAEWIFLVTFSMEWMAGLIYSVLPSYVDVLFKQECLVHQPEHMHILFLFRLLRLFRILRLAKLLLRSDKVEIFHRALLDALPAFFICAGIVSTAVFVPGVLMYHAEQGVWFEKWHCYRRQLDDGTLENACSPFQNIPAAMYWAVTTVTTVGYGDITPVTSVGRTIAGFSMLLAMLSIAIPVGMITNSFNNAMESMKEEMAAKKDRLRKRREKSSESIVLPISPSKDKPHLRRSGDTWDLIS